MVKIKRPKIIVIGGPTASGKSALAIALARRFDGEIISADSRQVYRGLDIGSGKVSRDRSKKYEVRMSKSESANSPFAIRTSYFSNGVRHWMLDVASPMRQYSVAQWKAAAQRAVRDIIRRGKVPVICGGTGFWIDSLVYDISLPPVKPDAKLRAKLSKLAPPELYVRLKKLDPVRAATIDRYNPRRLVRALEIIMTTGRPVPQVRSTNDEWRSPYAVLYLGITRPMPELKRRIAKRLDARLKGGMVSEVKRLHASGVSWKRLESFGLEYRHVARYLRSKYGSTTSTFGIRTSSFQAMRSALLGDIIRYSKRQMTWWRKNPDVIRVKTENETVRLVRHFLSG